jgi:hypothetical protein
MSNTQPLNWNTTEVKAIIATSEEAKEMGAWDAKLGLKCNADAYTFADANDINGSYLSGEYTFAYTQAKGW